MSVQHLFVCLLTQSSKAAGPRRFTNTQDYPRAAHVDRSQERCVQQSVPLKILDNPRHPLVLLRIATAHNTPWNWKPATQKRTWQVNLVEDGHNLQVILQRQPHISKGLCLNTLAGINHQQGTLTGSKATGHLRHTHTQQTWAKTATPPQQTCSGEAQGWEERWQVVGTQGRCGCEGKS